MTPTLVFWGVKKKNNYIKKWMGMMWCIISSIKRSYFVASPKLLSEALSKFEGAMSTTCISIHARTCTRTRTHKERKRRGVRLTLDFISQVLCCTEIK